LEDRGLGLWGVGRRRQRRVGGVGPEPLLQVFELPLQFIDALPQRLNDGVAPGTSRAFHFAHAFILRSPALNREKRWAVTPWIPRASWTSARCSAKPSTFRPTRPFGFTPPSGDRSRFCVARTTTSGFGSTARKSTSACSHAARCPTRMRSRPPWNPA